MSEVDTPILENAKNVEQYPTVKEMVHCLIREKHMSASEISEALGLRVSRRTIYRWLRAESLPQQNSDLNELKKLYVEKTAGK